MSCKVKVNKHGFPWPSELYRNRIEAWESTRAPISGKFPALLRCQVSRLDETNGLMPFNAVLDLPALTEIDCKDTPAPEERSIPRKRLTHEPLARGRVNHQNRAGAGGAACQKYSEDEQSFHL